MDRLMAMQMFVRVVETGSFSAVARELATTQSAVSKQVAALERHLGAPLLARTTRALSLTDEGRVYFDAAQRLVHDAQEAEQSVRAGRERLSGRLRIGASVGFGRLVLFPIVQRFMAAYPDVTVDLQLADGFVDVVGEGLDAAVRIGELGDSSLIAQRVGTATRSAVVSRTWLDALPPGTAAPAVPEDLLHHPCIVYTGLVTRNHWAFEHQGKTRSVQVSGPLSTSSSEIAREAVLAGMGIGFSPAWLFERELLDGTVLRLLPGYAPPPLPIHVVYPTSRRHSARVRAFTESVRHALGPIAA
jgi:DNA-binding transcriptional LysR family regulator